MNNLEKEIQDKTAEEIYDFLWFLFHDYGCSFTDSRKAIIEWIEGKREMNPVLYDYKFGDVQTDKDLIHLQKEQAYMQGYEEGQKSRKGKWIEHEWAEKRGEILISNYECTVCGEWVRENSDFCPNCGADMRSESRKYLEYGKLIAKGIEQGLRGDLE